MNFPQTNSKAALQRSDSQHLRAAPPNGSRADTISPVVYGEAQTNIFDEQCSGRVTKVRTGSGEGGGNEGESGEGTLTCDLSGDRQ